MNSGTFSITAACGRWNSRAGTGAHVEREASCSGFPDFLPRALALPWQQGEASRMSCASTCSQRAW